MPNFAFFKTCKARREKYKNSLNPPKKSSVFKASFEILFFLSLYILLPIRLTKGIPGLSIKLLFIFYLINVLVGLYLFRRNSIKKYNLAYQIQGLEEKINVLNDQNLKELEAHASLKEKIERYNSLKSITEEISQSLDLTFVAEHLNSIAFSLISKNKGTCILYLVDNQTQRLSLCRSKKENSSLIIKAKEGDIFDFWVLRHNSPLLIEDIKRDFRFDLEKSRLQEQRPISSLISSPFISESKFLGLLRLDHPSPNFYTLDDLRFLRTISDLGAVALENSELFQRTEQLAIQDGLTGLYTKAYFLERLREECKRGIRQKVVFSLLMLDIDYFKNYNDRYGHTAGDVVLRNLSQNIRESLKERDAIIGRFGGEEFCIVMLGADKKEAYQFACQLRQKIDETKIILRRQETHITVSIGVAGFPFDADAEDELILKSDKAMYEAKQRGRNQVCCI